MFYPDFNLYAEPELALAARPPRAETLAQIESGALEYIDIPARVYIDKPNKNGLRPGHDDLPRFSASFVDKPMQRDHSMMLDARDGIILSSEVQGQQIHQVLRITTRRGMVDYVEGKIDRFSIGWHAGDSIICSVCGTEWNACSHMPGRKYSGKLCELYFPNATGKETSAVVDPAVDGTGLLAVLSTFKKEITVMNEKDETPDGEKNPTLAKLEANALALDKMLGAQQRQEALDAQVAQGNVILAAQCKHLLNSALAAARLPEVTANRLRKQYEGAVFEPETLQASIDEARAEVSALQGSVTVNGIHRVSNMLDSVDEFRAAFDDLIGAERAPDMVGKKVHRLSGIREAYLRGTGDAEFVGGFDPTYDLFALGTTGTFPGIVKDSLNKMLVKAWDKYGQEGYNWWQDIVTIEHFDTLNTPDWIRTGTIGSLPVVAENGDYQELPVGDNTETSAWYKYGGFIELTLEAILRDNLNAFKKMPNEVALGAYRNISEQVAAIFTTNSAAGPVMADGGALFNATAVTTAGGHANLLTTALGTDFTAWKAVSNAMFKQPMLIGATTYGTGKRQTVRPKFVLVPVDLADAAFDLFLQRQSPIASRMDSNRYFGEVFPLVVPEWTDVTDWAAVANPKILPGIMLGEIFGVMPTIIVAGGERDGAMFANDTSRIKVRQFLNVGVADWRALHKENVGG